MKTEKLLTELFDLQRFERDPALQKVIDGAVARRQRRALSDEELDMVSAAGGPYLQIRDPKNKDGPP